MCNRDIERRQAWRETDGFAKAGEAMPVRNLDWEARMMRNAMGSVSGQAESPLKFATVDDRAAPFLGRSPLFLQIALGFYTKLDFQPPPFEAQREICEQMVKVGLLRHDPVDGATYMHYVAVHEALKVYVESLCSVPLPIKRWVMP